MRRKNRLFEKLKFGVSGSITSTVENRSRLGNMLHLIKRGEIVVGSLGISLNFHSNTVITQNNVSLNNVKFVILPLLVDFLETKYIFV